MDPNQLNPIQSEANQPLIDRSSDQKVVLSQSEKKGISKKLKNIFGIKLNFGQFIAGFFSLLLLKAFVFYFSVYNPELSEYFQVFSLYWIPIALILFVFFRKLWLFFLGTIIGDILGISLSLFFIMKF